MCSRGLNLMSVDSCCRIFSKAQLWRWMKANWPKKYKLGQCSEGSHNYQVSNCHVMFLFGRLLRAYSHLSSLEYRVKILWTPPLEMIGRVWGLCWENKGLCTLGLQSMYTIGSKKWTVSMWLTTFCKCNIFQSMRFGACWWKRPCTMG